jgi:hypothetical protein
MVWVLNFSLKFLLIVFFIAAPTQAAEDSRVFVPNPPKGKGENCVRDTVFMRANHMNLLMHQRDKTVLEGIRTKQYSLKECVACHAVLDSNGQPVSYQTPKHFCRSCHDYAAVKIDCFECHASKPPQEKVKGHPRRQISTFPNAENAYRVSKGFPQ